LEAVGHVSANDYHDVPEPAVAKACKGTTTPSPVKASASMVPRELRVFSSEGSDDARGWVTAGETEGTVYPQRRGRQARRRANAGSGLVSRNVACSSETRDVTPRLRGTRAEPALDLVRPLLVNAEERPAQTVDEPQVRLAVRQRALHRVGDVEPPREVGQIAP
jgi:hypothetical protein